MRLLALWAAGALLSLAALRALALFLEPRLAFYPARGPGATPADLGIAYRELPIRTADGETLTAWWLPHPGAVAEAVFWHGNGGNLSVWLDVLQGFHAQRVAVLAFDYRGYGTSTGSPTEAGLYRDSDAVVRTFLAELHRPGIPVLYWGRSLGGAPAAYAATRRAGRPDALVLESAFPDARALFRRDPLLKLLSLFSSYRFPTAGFASRFRGPVLVIHGDADRVVPAGLGRELFGRLAGAKRFVTIAGGDHDGVHAADPETYWGAVLDLVGSVKEAATADSIQA